MSPYPTEHNPRKRLLLETPEALQRLAEFDYALSATNGPNDYLYYTPSSIYLPRNDSSPIIHTLVTHKDKRARRATLDLAVEPKRVQFAPYFDPNIPPYIPKAYARFARQVNESEELNELKFIGVLRFCLTVVRHDRKKYIWHQNEKVANMDEENPKGFSYSIVGLNKFPKTKEQLKSHQDKWLALFLCGSKMTEEEVQEVFGDDPIFQEVFQILKLDHLTPEELEQYNFLENIRQGNEKWIKNYYKEGRKLLRRRGHVTVANQQEKKKEEGDISMADQEEDRKDDVSTTDQGEETEDDVSTTDQGEETEDDVSTTDQGEETEDDVLTTTGQEDEAEGDVSTADQEDDETKGNVLTSDQEDETEGDVSTTDQDEETEDLTSTISNNKIIFSMIGGGRRLEETLSMMSQRSDDEEDHHLPMIRQRLEEDPLIVNGGQKFENGVGSPFKLISQKSEEDLSMISRGLKEHLSVIHNGKSREEMEDFLMGHQKKTSLSAISRWVDDDLSTIGEKLEENLTKGWEMGVSLGRKIGLEMTRRKAMRRVIIIEDIVGPIVDENFDYQGFLKLDPKRNRPTWMGISMVTQPRNSVQNTTHHREKWTREEIEKLKEDIIFELERHGFISSIYTPGDDSDLEDESTLEIYSESEVFQDDPILI
jgi:hypothetical protein